MSALNKRTGRALDPNSDEHLEQSVGDIVTTPLGSRVARRGYGSDNPDLIDQPLNALLRMKIFASTAMALQRWEPRLRLKRVQLQAGASGAARLHIEGVRTDRPRRPAVAFSIPLRTS